MLSDRVIIFVQNLCNLINVIFPCVVESKITCFATYNKFRSVRLHHQLLSLQLLLQVLDVVLDAIHLLLPLGQLLVELQQLIHLVGEQGCNIRKCK